MVVEVRRSLPAGMWRAEWPKSKRSDYSFINWIWTNSSFRCIWWWIPPTTPWGAELGSQGSLRGRRGGKRGWTDKENGWQILPQQLSIIVTSGEEPRKVSQSHQKTPPPPSSILCSSFPFFSAASSAWSTPWCSRCWHGNTLMCRVTQWGGGGEQKCIWDTEL